MPDSTSSTTSSPSQNASADQGALLKKKHQNLTRIGEKIRTGYAKAATPYISTVFLQEFRDSHAHKAAYVIAQRTPLFLPKENLTRESISEAVLKAANEYAQNNVEFDEILPKNRRAQVASAVAGSFDLAAEQRSLQAALGEIPGYLKDLDLSLPSTKTVEKDIRDRLHQHDIDRETSRQIARDIRSKVDQEALRNGAEPSPEAQRAMVQTAIDRNTDDLSSQQQEQLTDGVMESGSLKSRAQSVGGLSGEINSVLDKYERFSEHVKNEIEKDVEVSVADESNDRQPTTIHLKQPIEINGEKHIKIVVHNRTKESDPNLPDNAAMPTFQYGTRIQRPKDVKLDSIESFTVYDPKTKKRVYINKDQIDTRALRKIDSKAAQKYGFLFDEKNIKSFREARDWINNPTKMAYRKATAPVRKAVRKLTAPIRRQVRQVRSKVSAAARRLTSPVRKLVSKVTTPIKQVYGKAKTAVKKVVSKVTDPIKRLVKKLMLKLGQLAAKALIKVGLGGLVKKIEQLALAGTGVGILIVIAQELIERGLGKMFQAIKGLAKDYKEAIKEGLRDPIKGSLRLMGTVADTGMTVAGAAVGATGGAAVGALVGGLIGSVVPVIGTAIGAVLGGIVGGVAGGGFGAKAGYEFRRKLIKKFKRWLVMRLFWKSLGRVIWTAIKSAALGWVGSVVAGVVNFATNIVAGAKNLILQPITTGKQLIYIARHYTFIEGPVANLINGTSNLIKNAFSNAVRAVNALAGETLKTSTKSLAKAEQVMLEATSNTTPRWLYLTSVGSIGYVIVMALFVYTVMLGVFHVPPTEVIPYLGYGLGSGYGTEQSQYIGVVKNANPDRIVSNSNLPATITYTVTITAQGSDLANIAFNNTYTIRQDPLLAGPPSTTIPSPPLTPILDGSTYSLTYAVDLGTQYADSFVCDNFTVTADTVAGRDSSTSVACVMIGNPPDDCPFGWPVLPPAGMSFLRITQGNRGICTHGALESALDIFGQTPSQQLVGAAVIATHQGTAAQGSSGNYGSYVDVTGVCNGQPFTTRYAHLRSDTRVPNGPVNYGTTVGHTSNTGTGPENNHLHYEVRGGVLPMEPPNIPEFVLPRGCCNYRGIACIDTSGNPSRIP